MSNDLSLDAHLKAAKQLEKKYDWLGAADSYVKASELALEEEDSLTAAQLCERLGFSFYRAALQAETNTEFIKRINQAIKAYDRECELLKRVAKADIQDRIDHASGLAAFARHWLETNTLVRKRFLEKSLASERLVLAACERRGDRLSIGKACNHMLEYLFFLFWLSMDKIGRGKNAKEGAEIAEKAIQALSKLEDNYELARAYRFAAFNCIGTFRGRTEICQDYLDKALEYSKKTGDAWLIGFSYGPAWSIAGGNLNPHLALEYAKHVIEFGTAAKDNFLIGHGASFSVTTLGILTSVIEDPDKQKENLLEIEKMAHEATIRGHIINYPPIFLLSYSNRGHALAKLASIETDPTRKQSLFERAIEVLQEGSERLRDWNLESFMFNPLSDAMFSFSVTKSEIEEKRNLLYESQAYANKALALHTSRSTMIGFARSGDYYRLARVDEELAKIETNNTKKARLLSKALALIENSIKIIEKHEKNLSDWTIGTSYGRFYEKLGRILQQIHFLTKEKDSLYKAVEAYEKASLNSKRANLPIHEAESYWHAAQLCGQLNKHQKASKSYESASKAYDLAAKKIPRIKEFYRNHSVYMQAWSQIEQAKYAHSTEAYYQAEEHYETAAKLHESSELWSHLASNYYSWAKMEEAESLSRGENPQKAKLMFEKALEQLIKAENAIKHTTGKTNSDEEREMVRRLLQASKLRRKFCQARILMEEAKLLGNKGKYLQSSRNYAEAANKISAITEKTGAEAERKEFEYLAILCRAWEKMATAEERTSSEAFLEAAELFEKAKDYCYTRRASLWALGNSNFCKGLAAGTRYQDSLDLKENAVAKSHMNRAATMYQQAGFKNASEYAKATQRWFDAYVFMNQAESEPDPEKRAKKYQMAEQLLQIAAGSFVKAEQPEKRAQVQQILQTVREEKTLAISLNDVMHAPAITSTTSAFTAPTPTNEASVGLESFEHANVQANLIATVKKVKVGESFCLTVEFVNTGREPALLMKVKDFVPLGFVVVKKPEIYRLENSCLNMKGKQITPLKLVEAELVLQPSKKGIYQLEPTIHYLNEVGQNKSLKMKSVEIKVEEVILADRVSTGTKELNSLLLGGIPKEYAVALAAPPSDEREQIISNFLEAGTGEGQTSFYAATEPVDLEKMLQKSSFYLFLCNPKPKIKVPDLPNVTKLSSKTDINNLNIALVLNNRRLNQKQPMEKRLCLGIVSDVLLRLGPEITRRWLAELITDFTSKGFTILAVMDPSMHPADQANAILNLFDGEISITQTEDPQECKKSIRIKKLRNQDYIKNPICLTKA